MNEKSRKMRKNNLFLLTALGLTAANFLGFLAIGPFTPYTLFIGLPAGLAALIYLSRQIITAASRRDIRFLAGVLIAINVLVLYLTLNFL